jgi:hypothetical protein
MSERKDRGESERMCMSRISEPCEACGLCSQCVLVGKRGLTLKIGEVPLPVFERVASKVDECGVGVNPRTRALGRRGRKEQMQRAVVRRARMLAERALYGYLLHGFCVIDWSGTGEVVPPEELRTEQYEDGQSRIVRRDGRKAMVLTEDKPWGHGSLGEVQFPVKCVLRR